MFDFVPAFLLWAVTIWRALPTFRRREGLSLWIAFAALSVAMTLRPGAATVAVDHHLHITNLSFLLKHTCGIIAAAAVLAFVADMAEAKGNFRPSRMHRAVPIVTVALLAGMFFATPQPVEADDLLTDYANHATILGYGLAWTVYLGTALSSATALCWRWGRRPGSGLVGRGLLLTGAGTAIGLLYAAHRVFALVLKYNGRSLLGDQEDKTTSTRLLFAALLLIMLGSTLPAVPRITRRLRAHWCLARLYPLWRTLTDAVPASRLHPPAGRLADAMSPRRSHDRLYRRTIELRDAILTLSAYTTPVIRARAYNHALASGLIGAQADVAAEACWLAVARERCLRGDPLSGETVPPASGGRDLSTEIRALINLSTAYRSHPTQSFLHVTSEDTA
ncbi:MAB_1171c family putative transporter [Streptomyces sp. CL12]|uniref:MAB_1171c family putative transporter n=1 Tax=Streptomyces sp. CL12 TaxID=3391744 RepID=UPI003A809FE9